MLDLAVQVDGWFRNTNETGLQGKRLYHLRWTIVYAINITYSITKVCSRSYGQSSFDLINIRKPLILQCLTKDLILLVLFKSTSAVEGPLWCCLCIINSYSNLLNWPIVSLLFLFLFFSMFFVLIHDYTVLYWLSLLQIMLLQLHLYMTLIYSYAFPITTSENCTWEIFFCKNFIFADWAIPWCSYLD